MITDIMRQKARIGMALALPEYIVFEKEKPRPGRLNNLLGRLRRECEKRLGYMIDRAVLSPGESDLMRRKVEEFGKRTGWEKKTKHVMTYLSFLLALFEIYPEEGIIGALNDIASFLEQGGESPAASMPAGSLAAEKWEEIWGE